MEMKQMINIYLAGKMSGLTWEEMSDWRSKAKKLFSHRWRGLNIINPCNFYNFNNVKSLKATDLEIMAFDLTAVRNAHLLLVDLRHDSIGTAIEIFEAYDKNIYDDIRNTDEIFEDTENIF